MKPSSCSELSLSLFHFTFPNHFIKTNSSPNLKSSIMPSGKGYTVTGSGTNSQGNHYCNRDYGSSASNQNSYHYSNTNGSYYYSNPNGSTYYSSPSGQGTYTPPSGSGSGSSSK
ncbi:uncharacterized protein N7515_010393 [Penicillium bovifimosum]|uniref:Uncharacterized protein n=1 Tax=Penicillium bovifimosum TaxID=126998 RepID=A0A9W9GFE4_9EURO|nr:uncharacterized protein N7515_010393 [Penicillium bovifimosum]KAJ5118170.1 hypothetical protein N7515_010393 [Penicillium bovifimosum]